MKSVMKRKQISKVVLAVMAVVLSLAVFGACAPKETDWEYIQSKGEIVLGFDKSFPPMGFEEVANSGQYVGFDIDLAKEVCIILGVTLKLQPISWDAKEAELSGKSIDVLWNGVTINEGRVKNMNMSSAYLKNNQVLVVKKGSTLATISDFAGKKIAFQTGSSAKEAVEANALLSALPSQNKVSVLDNVSALKNELETGLVDAVVMDEIVANYLISQGGQYKVLSEKLASEEYGVAVRKGDNLLVFKIEEALRTLAKDGVAGVNNGQSTLETIAIKWFGTADGLLVNTK